MTLSDLMFPTVKSEKDANVYTISQRFLPSSNSLKKKSKKFELFYKN